MIKRSFIFILIVLLIAFAGVQFIRPEIKNPPVTGEIDGPADVKSILRRACYDCHSNETNLHWYDQVAPVYWRVAAHVRDGRKHLNFSEWNSMAVAERKAKLWEAVNQIMAGGMPLKDYALVHSSANISKDELETLKKYMLSTVKSQPADSTKINELESQYSHWEKTPGIINNPVALNGIAYDSDYKHWQTISTTDRFDNGTMRVIFGNDVAIKAIKENHTNPWPNGTMFAKVAWDQLEDSSGNVHTGAFKQVEYMIKDDHKYASTLGWGWSRFKTPKLIPYGKDAMFTQECVGCHQPMSDRDFVFTMPVKY